MNEQNPGTGGRDVSPAAGDPILEAADRASTGDQTLDPDTEGRISRLQSDIQRTRADMSETIDAIQERLRPGNVVSRTAENVRDAAVRKVKQMTRGDGDDLPRRAGDWHRGNGLVERVRDNPIPAAIAVGSLAWLAFGRRPARDYVGPPWQRFQDHDPSYGGRAAEHPGRPGADYDEDDPEPQRTTSRSNPQSVVRRAGDAASEMGDRVMTFGSQAQRRVRQMAREHTLTAALVAAGIGVAIGLALPESNRENELMGDARDSIVNRAKSAARDTLGQVQQTAEQVQRMATDAIRSMGDDSAKPTQPRPESRTGSKRTT
jgi:ElaB/YqjD/DUF883 family membrane-anchored ribosome-binding protein